MGHEKITVLSADMAEQLVFTSIHDFCEQYGISEDLLAEWLEHGVIDIPKAPHAQIELTVETVYRVGKAKRLYHQLGINTPGIALALELLEQIHRLEQQMEALAAHLPGKK